MSKYSRLLFLTFRFPSQTHVFS